MFIFAVSNSFKAKIMVNLEKEVLQICKTLVPEGVFTVREMPIERLIELDAQNGFQVLFAFSDKYQPYVYGEVYTGGTPQRYNAFDWGFETVHHRDEPPSTRWNGFYCTDGIESFINTLKAEIEGYVNFLETYNRYSKDYQTVKKEWLDKGFYTDEA